MWVMRSCTHEAYAGLPPTCYLLPVTWTATFLGTPTPILPAIDVPGMHYEAQR